MKYLTALKIFFSVKIFTSLVQLLLHLVWEFIFWCFCLLSSGLLSIISLKLAIIVSNGKVMPAFTEVKGQHP